MATQDQHVQQYLHHHGRRGREVPRRLSASSLQRGSGQVQEGRPLHHPGHPRRRHRQHHQVPRGEDRGDSVPVRL